MKTKSCQQELSAALASKFEVKKIGDLLLPADDPYKQRVLRSLDDP